MPGLERSQVFRGFGDGNRLDDRRFDCDGGRLFVTSGLLLTAACEERRKAHERRATRAKQGSGGRYLRQHARLI